MYTISTTTITRVQVISNQCGDRVEVIIQHAAFLTDIMFRIKNQLVRIRTHDFRNER